MYNGSTVSLYYSFLFEKSEAMFTKQPAMYHLAELTQESV